MSQFGTHHVPIWDTPSLLLILHIPLYPNSCRLLTAFHCTHQTSIAGKD